MPKKMKDQVSPEAVQALASEILTTYASFDAVGFAGGVLDDEWSERSLMERIRHVAAALGRFLPAEYPKALRVLRSAAPGTHDFLALAFPEFVAVFGTDASHWDLSMEALAEFTPYYTAEFGIRPFLRMDLARGMAQMLAWAGDPNEHIRRLASEGCRPRLPWGIGLPALKADPTLILPILEELRDDPSLYVRKSVANNLNDISKDHPQTVLAFADRWIGQSKGTDWILRWGLRTLLKQAHPRAMALFGYADEKEESGPDFAEASLSLSRDRCRIGEDCVISYEVQTPPDAERLLRLAYVVDFQRPGGKHYRKQFQLGDAQLPGGARKKGAKKHSFAQLSTRRHYPGTHRITLWINGVEAASAELELLPEA